MDHNLPSPSPLEHSAERAEPPLSGEHASPESVVAHALAAHERESFITYDYVVEFGCCDCGTDFPDTPAGWTAYEIHRSRAVVRALESAGYVIRPSEPASPPTFESGRSSDHER